MTKEERRAYNRAWAAKNRTKIWEYSRKYYQRFRAEHREEYNAYHRAYYAAHKDIILANRKKVRHGTAADG